MQFQLAPGLTLPERAITQAWAFLGLRGSGKTYAAGKLVEVFLEVKVQCVILDPVGNWYGLRLNRTGKKPSKFHIPILGGVRGDVPLSKQSGGLVADFLVNTGSSAILDVSTFRKDERKHFVMELAEQLFHRKKVNPYPMHLVLEEAQLFAPEQHKGQERMLGAIEDIVRLGRNYGIGCSMISQRPQSVNKEVLNQAEPLVVFQLVAKHERLAVQHWLEHVGGDKTWLAELPGLEAGNGFFWSPAWMRTFQPLKVYCKHTYDATATPELRSNKKWVVGDKLAPVDLGALQEAMQQVVDEAKANDPKELKKRIAELERQLKQRQPRDEEYEASVNREMLKIVDDKWVHTVNQVCDKYDAAIAQARKAAAGLVELTAAKAPPTPPPRATVPTNNGPPRLPKHALTAGRAKLSKGERTVLTAIAQHDGCDRQQLSVLTGYKRSTRDLYLQKLAAAGYTFQADGQVKISPEGREVLGDYELLPRGVELQEHWLQRLPAGEAAHLQELINHYPHPMSRDTLSDRLDYKRSTRDLYLQKLASRKLIEVSGPGMVIASSNLFD